MKNVIETAVNNPDFSTLVTAITAAGLIDTLSGTGPFTIFAPNNAAFAKIPKVTLDSVLADKPKLTSILTYHVVPLKVSLAEVKKLTETKTVEGSKLKISTPSTVTETNTPNVATTAGEKVGAVTINDAHIITPDIECSNGVIHVIDTVLIP